MVDGFIIGLQRSGTTLLRGILGAHSQIFTAGELFLTLETDYGKGLAIKQADLLGDVFRWLEQSVPEKIQFWMKETTWEVEAWENYCKAAPDHKVVAIVRDWRDQFCSQAEMGWCYLKQPSVLEYSSYYAEVFHPCFQKWMESRPSLLIHYEELTADPEKQIASIMKHVGLPAEEEQLNPFKWQIYGQGDPKLQSKRVSVSNKSVGRWKRDFPDIEKYMHPEALRLNRQYGY